ncbi:hypothetical protein J1N35_004186 [Gossypium stocksii]|uniref:CASP-like protein n=1 Tax=Gossypium stocksii TaxID=47602 RepID=A0A9D4AI36_9ROSI|nr:hypothetical protein J1N35_004186 [Gossypium stocksii]
MQPRPPTPSFIPSKLTVNFVLPYASKLATKEITSTLTFATACASAGITVLINNDLNSCAHNHFSQFETATAMAFISWLTTLPSFLLNFWSLAS